MRSSSYAFYHRSLAVVALSVFAVGIGWAASWAEPRLLLFLNRSEVSTPIVGVERTGAEVYVPIAPVAERLQAGLEWAAAAGRLTVTDPVLGRVTEYEQATGLVRRDGALRFGLGAGLLRGSQVADLRGPLPLLAILFELDAEIPPSGDRIELTSRFGSSGSQLHGPARVHMRDLRYNGYANRYDGFTDGGLAVDASARLSSGILETSTLGLGEEGKIACLRSATVTYRDARQSIWSAGDLRGVGEMPWLLAAGRGAC